MFRVRKVKLRNAVNAAAAMEQAAAGDDGPDVSVGSDAVNMGVQGRRQDRRAASVATAAGSAISDDDGAVTSPPQRRAAALLATTQPTRDTMDDAASSDSDSGSNPHPIRVGYKTLPNTPEKKRGGSTGSGPRGGKVARPHRAAVEGPGAAAAAAAAAHHGDVLTGIDQLLPAPGSKSAGTGSRGKPPVSGGPRADKPSSRRGRGQGRGRARARVQSTNPIADAVVAQLGPSARVQPPIPAGGGVVQTSAPLTALGQQHVPPDVQVAGLAGGGLLGLGAAAATTGTTQLLLLHQLQQQQAAAMALAAAATGSGGGASAAAAAQAINAAGAAAAALPHHGLGGLMNHLQQGTQVTAAVGAMAQSTAGNSLQASQYSLGATGGTQL